MPFLWDELCPFQRVCQNQAYGLWAFSPKRRGWGWEDHWPLSWGAFSFQLFMSNSVLIACSLVVSEEGGHGEAVIRSERRLRGHAEKPFVLPATHLPRLYTSAQQTHWLPGARCDGNVLWLVAGTVWGGRRCHSGPPQKGITTTVNYRGISEYFPEIFVMTRSFNRSHITNAHLPFPWVAMDTFLLLYKQMQGNWKTFSPSHLNCHLHREAPPSIRLRLWK